MKGKILFVTASIILSSNAVAGSEGLYYDSDEAEFEGFYGDDDFVSLSTGTKKTISKAPSVASVITARDIATMGARTLGEVLETVPGLHVSRSASLMAPRYIFRGISSRSNPQALVLVNGSPISSVVRGDRHTPSGEFPVHSISRIEIIRGPGSATHGADAYAGVINIITKDYDDMHNSDVGGLWGSFQTSDIWVNHKVAFGKLKLALSGEYTDSAGQDGIIEWDAQSAIDQTAVDLGLNVPAVSHAPGKVNVGYRGWDLRVAADYEGWKLRVGYQDRENVGTGQGVASALDPDGKMGSEKMQIILRHDSNLAKDWKMNLEYWYYRSKQQVDEPLKLLPPGAVFGKFPDGLSGNPEWSEQSFQFQPKFTYTGLESHVVSFGLGYREEDLFEVKESRNFDENLNPLDSLVDVSDTPDVYMPEANGNNYFGFIQDEYQLAPDWELTLGVRYDDYSDFGATTNPRLAVVWATDRNLSTKFLYGRAFRKPAFAETIAVNNPLYLGNPDVKPETIDTYELAFNYQFSPSMHVDLNVFRFEAKRLIEWVPDVGASTRTAQNIGQLKGYGLEMEIFYKASSDLSFTGNYSYQNVKDKSTDDYYGSGAPNSQVYARAQWQYSDDISANLYLSYLGKIYRNYYDSRAPIHSFTDVGFYVRFEHLFEDFSVQLKATNLLDREHKEPSLGVSASIPKSDIPYDLPQAGRAWYVSVTRTF